MKTTNSKFGLVKCVGAIVCLMMMSVSSAKAQDFFAGSPAWCMQQQQQLNAMSMQCMMMQQQLSNFYSNQRMAVEQQIMNNPFQPVQGVYTYDGTYITPENVNSYHREYVKCEHCDGGYNYKDMYAGSGKTNRVKIRCSFCHGKGYTTKHVRND